MSELTRRRLLAAGGVAAAGAVAGCSSSQASEDGDDNPTDGTVLGDVSVENLHGEEHTVDVMIEFDDEIVHWSTHRLDGTEPGTELERDWPDEPGTIRLTVRHNEGSTTHVTPAMWNDPPCLNLMIWVDRSGDLSVMSSTTGGPCSEYRSDDEEA